jgi:amino acid transporter
MSERRRVVESNVSAPISAVHVIDKGLKRNAVSFVANVAIGVASTSPAYSVAATLGAIAAFAAFFTPAVMLVAFIPMLLIALACYHLNRVDPDCGTTFSWVTRAMGPYAGWMGGWSIIVTDILVMPSLAAVAADYSFELFGLNYHPHTVAVPLVGAAWIAIMTLICYLGIEISARTQQLLLAAELAILMLFAGIALFHVYAGTAPAGARHLSAAWFNPFNIDGLNNFAEALLLAVFIYWGWDTGISVNEETKHPGTTPGYAAVVSTVVLVGIYAAVATAAVAFAGPDVLAKHTDDVLAALGADVLGSRFDKLLTLAVLASAVASAQTTILPTTRMAVSMASAGAIPYRFGKIQPRYLSPGFSTLLMGAISIIWYLGLTALSTNVLADSILALGLVIAFYYGLTGFACVILFRHVLLESAWNFVSIGLLPGVGGVIMFLLFGKMYVDLAKPSAGTTVVFGVGGPLVIGLGALMVGLILMLIARGGLPEFFRRQNNTKART